MKKRYTYINLSSSPQSSLFEHWALRIGLLAFKTSRVTLMEEMTSAQFWLATRTSVCMQPLLGRARQIVHKCRFHELRTILPLEERGLGG